jgi:acetyltransferase-like isoleucine patch superfamily enzyme
MSIAYSNAKLRSTTRRYHLYEWLWAAVAIPIYGIPAYIGIETVREAYAMFGIVGIVVGIPVAIFLALVIITLLTGFLQRMISPIEEGSYPLGARSRPVLFWMLRYGVCNYLRLPNLVPMLYANPLLRGLYFRSAGAKIHPSARISYDARLLDPSLLEIGEGTKIGAYTVATGHYSDERNFILGRIRIGKNVLIGGEVILGPNTILGDGCVIQGRSTVLPGTKVGAGEVWGGSPARLRREQIVYEKNGMEVRHVAAL